MGLYVVIPEAISLPITVHAIGFGWSMGMYILYGLLINRLSITYYRTNMVDIIQVSKT